MPGSASPLFNELSSHEGRELSELLHGERNQAKRMAPVKQVDVFREANEELLELGPTGHVFKEEFLARDGDMLANMKIEVDNVGQRWDRIFNVAWPSPNRPPDPCDRAAVYAVIPMGNGGQEGLQLPQVVLWAQRVPQGLSTKYAGLFLVKVGYVRATSDAPQLWHWDMPLNL